MKLNINSARKGNSSYTFSPLSLVSLDFGRLQPVQCFSTILGDKFSSVVGKGVLRCTPQVFPPFGRMNLKSASFFVPDSQLFSWSSAFHSDNKNWRGQIADSVPVFDHHELNYVFGTLNNLSSVVASNPASEPAYNTFDFCYPSANRQSSHTNLNYFRLTSLGWKLYAIFKSLGYDFVSFPVDDYSSHTQQDHISNNSSFVSFVPFLAYCKIWNDFFCNSYQCDNNIVSECLQNIYLNKDIVISGNTLYNSSNFRVDFSLATYLISFMHLPFESGMYTNAWNDPVDPTGVEKFSFNQINSQSLISPYGVTNGEFNTVSLAGDGASHFSPVDNFNRVHFSQLGHRTLQAIDNFVRRRGLLGSKVVQQLYGLFGIQPDEWSKDYVVKLSENSSRVNFSAITSQSDTVNGSSGKPLGAFAGVGLGGYDISFSYNCNTFGTIICLAWLNIDPIIMHGVSPDVLRVKPFDFYTPDFDGKAYRPIPYVEITGAKSIGENGYPAIDVYGYTNMYDDYRNMRDVVAGSFTDDTTRHFAFMRDLTETRRFCAANSVRMEPQISEVQYWQLDGGSDITNPFITDASLGDRFWFCIDWLIKCTRPILSSENSFDLEGEGNLTINKNGDGIA